MSKVLHDTKIDILKFVDHWVGIQICTIEFFGTDHSPVRISEVTGNFYDSAKINSH